MTTIPLFHVLDANDCAGDRICKVCMDEACQDEPLKSGERVVESGSGCCCWCGDGECASDYASIGGEV